MEPMKKTPKHLARGLALAGLGCAFAVPALAQDSPWELRVGVATVNLAAAQSKLWVGGEFVRGGDVAFKNNVTVAAELGYSLTPRLMARAILGLPPTTKMKAAGSLQNMVPPLSGNLGELQYGPFALTLTHDLGQWGRFKPYAGIGINYTMVFKKTDGDISRLKAKNAWGSVLQLGVDYQIDKHWSLFADARKIFVKSTATGIVPAFGGAPAKAEVKFDPLAVHVGLGYRF